MPVQAGAGQRIHLPHRPLCSGAGAWPPPARGWTVMSRAAAIGRMMAPDLGAETHDGQDGP